ncbi:MAG: hypothetical protein M3R15_12780, partial [Acidobacteriota bacterium]|nr:hypothetical protein [Acidobacteriota bacterium]
MLNSQPGSRSTLASRRGFLAGMGSGLIAAACAPRDVLATLARPVRRSGGGPLVLGKGPHRYEWVNDWAKLPSGMQLGSCHGGIVIDSQNRILLNTETENAVMIFDSDGKFIKAWGKDFKGGCHGMMVRREGRDELLYLTHTARHELIKLTLDGELVWTRGHPEQPGLYES